MSMVQQFIAAAANAERQLDMQMSQLTAYQAELDSVKAQVDEALGGSEQQYAQQMMAQLTATKDQVEKTVAQIQSAKERLLRVRMI